jgi:hypothetical protein
LNTLRQVDAIRKTRYHSSINCPDRATTHNRIWLAVCLQFKSIKS